MDGVVRHFRPLYRSLYIMALVLQAEEGTISFCGRMKASVPFHLYKCEPCRSRGGEAAVSAVQLGCCAIRRTSWLAHSQGYSQRVTRHNQKRDMLRTRALKRTR